jgi:hypothetical protein
MVVRTITLMIVRRTHGVLSRGPSADADAVEVVVLSHQLADVVVGMSDHDFEGGAFCDCELVAQVALPGRRERDSSRRIHRLTRGSRRTNVRRSK